jgi:hypothetical protein
MAPRFYDTTHLSSAAVHPHRPAPGMRYLEALVLCDHPAVVPDGAFLRHLAAAARSSGQQRGRAASYVARPSRRAINAASSRRATLLLASIGTSSRRICR